MPCDRFRWWLIATLATTCMFATTSTTAASVVGGSISDGPFPADHEPRPAPPAWNIARPLSILAAGGLLAAVSWDEADPDGMMNGIERLDAVDAVSDLGNRFGSGWTIGGGSAAVLATGLATGDGRIEAFGVDLCRAFLATSLVSGLIKVTLNRRRPSGGGLSFPSGHTSVAFSVVPVIGQHLGWRAGVLTGLLAVHTGLGRMEDRRHYLSDVIFGAALGLAVGDVVTQYRDRSDWLAGVTLTPQFVGYTMRF